MSKLEKRIIIEVSSEDHKEIKRRATNRGITIRKWVLDAIADKIKKEKQYE
jgi:predicted DNA binding CopG/RHH family protein